MVVSLAPLQHDQLPCVVAVALPDGRDDLRRGDIEAEPGLGELGHAEGRRDRVGLGVERVAAAHGEGVAGEGAWGYRRGWFRNSAGPRRTRRKSLLQRDLNCGPKMSGVRRQWGGVILNSATAVPGSIPIPRTEQESRDRERLQEQSCLPQLQGSIRDPRGHGRQEGQVPEVWPAIHHRCC